MMTMQAVQGWMRMLPPRRAGAVRCSERGEGVISAAIAVLIMAFLGVAMWIGFNEIWNTSKDTTQEQVGEIGQ